jgi:hypothetical protein
VQVVGYDNNRQAWLIKNSWGPDFADKGYAWIAFDAPSMCDPLDTYGFVFEPYLPPAAAPAKLTPAPGRKGCYTYRAVAGDYPDKLSLRFGIRVQQLLLDNLDVITDPSTVPENATLLLCSVNAGAVPGVVVAQGNASAARTQGATTTTSISGNNEEVRVLMAIKRMLDPCGCSLTDWNLDSASPCGWTGIICDTASGRVTQIYNWDDTWKRSRLELSGQLPSGALLARLPALVAVVLLETKGLTGPLPEDWSQLTQLRIVTLSGNSLTGAAVSSGLHPHMPCTLLLPLAWHGHSMCVGSIVTCLACVQAASRCCFVTPSAAPCMTPVTSSMPPAAATAAFLPDAFPCPALLLPRYPAGILVS